VKVTSPLFRALMTLDGEDEDGLNRNRMIDVVRILREPQEAREEGGRQVKEGEREENTKSQSEGKEGRERLVVSADWEWKAFFDSVDSHYVDMCEMIQRAFDSMKALTDQKEFAKEQESINSLPCCSI